LSSDKAGKDMSKEDTETWKKHVMEQLGETRTKVDDVHKYVTKQMEREAEAEKKKEKPSDDDDFWS
jgi:hypothetical protein